MTSERSQRPGGRALTDAIDADSSPDVIGRRTLTRALQRRAAAPGLSADSAEESHRVAERGVAGAPQPLPHGDEIRSSFGSFGDVVDQIGAHTNSQAGDASTALGARAYATGSQIAFAGKSDLHTSAHEAAHVVQQRQGVFLKDGLGDTGDLYEQHADAVADRVVAGTSAEDLLARSPGGGGRNRGVQRKVDSAPSGAEGVHDAAGAALEAVGPVIEGPLPPSTEARSGDLTVEQEADEVTFVLGRSRAKLRADRSSAGPGYRFRVPPAANPRQRVVSVVATWEVAVTRALDPDADVDLAVQIDRAGEDDPRLAPRGAPVAGPVIQLADVLAMGDERRASVMLDQSQVHIEAKEPDARFAYYVDPEWSGDDRMERVLHVVATTGVAIDEHRNLPPALGRQGRRTLVANAIYVQSPHVVPAQGTPFAPSDFLGSKRFELGPDPRNALSLYTGSAGVTLRDERLGAAVSIRVDDPASSARFAYELDFQPGRLAELRVLVTPGVTVDVREAVRHLPGDLEDPYRDLLNSNVVVYETDRPEHVPPQGAPLPLAILMTVGKPRAPDRVEAPPKSGGQVASELAADVAVGVTPGIGDVADLTELGHALSSGTDKWGNPLSTAELVVMGIATLLPIVPIAIVKAGGKGARASKAASQVEQLGSRLGRSPEEVEAIAAHLRNMSPAAEAAVRRVEAGLQSGQKIDPDDFAKIRDAMRSIGFGELPATMPARPGVMGVPDGATIEVPGWTDGAAPGAKASAATGDTALTDASAATPVAMGRKTEPVPGLFEEIPHSLHEVTFLGGIKGTVTDQIRQGGNGREIIRTDVTIEGGKSGWFERAYDPQTKTFEMLNAFLNGLPVWVAQEGGPALTTKGIPSVTFFTLRQMKILEVGYGQISRIKMSTIQNVRAVIKYNALLRKGMLPEKAVLQTHSVEYASTAIQQSGHRIVKATVVPGRHSPLEEMLRHYETNGGRTRPDPAVVAEHDRLLKEYEKDDVARETVVHWDYDIYLDVAPYGGNP